MIEAFFSVLAVILMVAQIIYVAKLKRAIPSIDEIVDTFVEQMEEVFSKPQIKRAMSLLGKQGAEVKASGALREKVADNIMSQYPAIGLILDQFGLSPLEGLQLLNDPIIGRWIRGFLEGQAGGILKQQGGSSKPGEY